MFYPGNQTELVNNFLSLFTTIPRERVVFSKEEQKQIKSPRFFLNYTPGIDWFRGPHPTKALSALNIAIKYNLVIILLLSCCAFYKQKKGDLYLTRLLIIEFSFIKMFNLRNHTRLAYNFLSLFRTIPREIVGK